MTKENEKWVAVEVGGFFEGLYEISNMGRVKILSKLLNARHGKRKTKQRITLGHPTTNGYRDIIFKKQGVYKHASVHRLVAENFVPNPENKPYVNHKNAIKWDNRAENLEWVTPSENNYHASALGINNALKGENHPRAKLTEAQVVEIRKLYKSGKHTHRGLSERFGVAFSQIRGIVTYATWKHVK